MKDILEEAGVKTVSSYMCAMHVGVIFLAGVKT